jgi:hypothetical protein
MPALAWRLEGTLALGITPVTLRATSPGDPDRSELASSLSAQARASWSRGGLEIFGGLRGLVQKDSRVFHAPVRQWGVFVGGGLSGRSHL